MSMLRRLNKVICLVLIICIMCFSVFGDFNTQKVYAFALTSTTIAVICCILISCGIVANNSDSLVAAADSFKAWLDSKSTSSGSAYQANISDINGMASAWVGGAPMIVSGSLKNSLREWAEENGYTSGATSFNTSSVNFNPNLNNLVPLGKTLVVGDYLVFRTSTGQVFYSTTIDFNSDFTPGWNCNSVWQPSSLISFSRVLSNGDIRKFEWFSTGRIVEYINGNVFNIFSNSGIVSYSGFIDHYKFAGTVSGFTASDYGIEIIGVLSSSPQPSLNIPSASLTVNPKIIPTSTGNTGTTVVTPDWPVTTSSDGTKAVSIPSTLPNIETIPAAGTASGSLTSTGEGTGIFEGVGSMVLDIPIVGTIAQALANIYSLLTNFFNFDGFELDFKPLKLNMLPEVFPFCIPFDFVNLVKMFSVESSAFVFEINYSNTYFTINHTVDLNPFRIPILFFRYVVVAWFSYILISKTRTLIKW